MHLLTNGISIMSTTDGILSSIGVYIDNAIYWLAGLVLKAFYDVISLGTQISLNGNEIHYIAQRLMVLAAIYALFRLSVMLINYIIDPAKTKDGQKTGVTIIKNVLIAVILLVTSSFMFEQLAVFERSVLIGYQDEEGNETPGLIPMIIYGREKAPQSGFGSENEAHGYVNKMWSVFFKPLINDCDTTSNDKACVQYRAVISGDAPISSLANYTKYFDRTAIVPFIIGIVLVYYFVVAVFEVVKRIFKLLVLQIVYPIPLILSIDPTQKKDRIKGFFKTYFEIYAQVFIRVATFQLAIVIIDLLKNNLTALGDNISIILEAIIVIGILQGAKELPKVIEDAIGIHITGSKGRSFGSVLGGIAGGAAGLVGGAIAGGIAGKSFGAALAGAGRGVWNGASGGANAKNAGAVIKSSVDNVKNQYGFGGKVKGAGGLWNYGVGAAQNFFGGQAKDEATMAEYEKQIKDIDKDAESKRKEKESSIKAAREAQASLTRQQNIGNRSDELRNRLNNNIDRNFQSKYGSQMDYVNNNVDYQMLVNAQKQNIANGFYRDNEDYKQIDAERIEAKKRELMTEYESMKDDYYNSQLAISEFANEHQDIDLTTEEGREAFRNSDSEYARLSELYRQSMATNPNNDYLNQMNERAAILDEQVANYNSDTSRLYTEYNDYITSNGLEDRAIRNISDFERVDKISEASSEQIQDQINSSNDQIKNIEKEIESINKTAEEQKKKVEANKKSFEESAGYVRRNKRDEKPEVKPHASAPGMNSNSSDNNSNN